jgi:hypothetical protein
VEASLDKPSVVSTHGSRSSSCPRRPSDLSYGQLKLMPFWDPLRGDPRFEKLVEEAKKPVALK